MIEQIETSTLLTVIECDTCCQRKLLTGLEINIDDPEQFTEDFALAVSSDFAQVGTEWLCIPCADKQFDTAYLVTLEQTV